MFKKRIQNPCANIGGLCVKLKGLFLKTFKILGIEFGLAAISISLWANPSSIANMSSAGSIYKASFKSKSIFKINSSEWGSIPEFKLTLVAQSTVLLNDQVANASLKKSSIREIILKVIYNEAQIFVHLEWTDSTLNQVSERETASFGDSVAVEIPKDFTDRLPYVGMGDEKKNAYIYMQRAAEEITLYNEFVSAGFGSLTRTPKNISRMQMRYTKAEQKWQALLTLPLNQRNMKQYLLPLAFAIWDGEGSERGGNKFLSAWHFIELEHFAKNKKYIEQVTSQFAQGADIEKGKMLFHSVCLSCHRVGEQGQAKEGVAPNLKFIGTLSTESYLHDSLVEPNQVVVRHLNINRHYNKTETADKNRAYPVNETYRWYFVDENGTRTSKMPSFKSLDEKDLKNLIAYLKTI
jgi:complex iron-sulfur molybdoenzyme family reductase subunit gamma